MDCHADFDKSARNDAHEALSSRSNAKAQYATGVGFTMKFGGYAVKTAQG